MMLGPLFLEYLMGKREYECTPWSNRACQQCMAHSGCEPCAVDHTFSTFGGLIATTRALLLNTCANPWTKSTLEEAKGLPCGPMAQASQMTVAGRPIVQAMSAA